MVCLIAALLQRVSLTSRFLVLASASGFQKLIRTCSTLRFTRRATSSDSSQQPSLYDNIPTRQVVRTEIYGKPPLATSEPSAFRTAVSAQVSSDWEAKPRALRGPLPECSHKSHLRSQATAQSTPLPLRSPKT